MLYSLKVPLKLYPYLDYQYSQHSGAPPPFPTNTTAREQHHLRKHKFGLFKVPFIVLLQPYGLDEMFVAQNVALKHDACIGRWPLQAWGKGATYIPHFIYFTYVVEYPSTPSCLSRQRDRKEVHANAVLCCDALKTLPFLFGQDIGSAPIL